MAQAQVGVDGPEYDGKANWKNAHRLATDFFQWLYLPERNLLFSSDAVNGGVDLTAVERGKVHDIFVMYIVTYSDVRSLPKNQRNRLEPLVMAALKQQKKVKTKRYNDGVVVCSFARLDGTFAPYQDRLTARDKLKIQRENLQADKNGVVVGKEPIVFPDQPVLPINARIALQFLILASEPNIELCNVTIQGPKRNRYQVVTDLPLIVDETEDPVPLILLLHTGTTGLYRADVLMEFRRSCNDSNTEEEMTSFSILRPLVLSAAGDQAMVQMLQPTTPYVKKKKKPERGRPFDKANVLDSPKPAAGSGSNMVVYKRLKQYKIPIDVREACSKGEAESTLDPPSQNTPEQDLAEGYQSFWQNMLWFSELQTYDDIKLFDMEQASLNRHGRLFKLSVPGLAEGRPSVLRGDIVLCNWKGKQYRGRVDSVQLLDVILEFHNSFHRSFNVALDRVDLVRFTFSRTTFRTSHQGCLLAPAALRPEMLMPKPIHIDRIRMTNHQHESRIVPERLMWANRTLNEEQMAAVREIVQGTLRPMPYVIFGPPGTGKTTTLTEAIYQLARLKRCNPSQKKKYRILIVAPSNDATDVLVEKLSAYFPPSEMTRVLAFTRNLSDVPVAVRPYCQVDLDRAELAKCLSSSQIVASTVNLAARFSNMGKGLPKGFFDVVCFDEAGHATEPEVMGVAASLMNFQGDNVGQMIMSGDPNQLGPVITSHVCQKFGMGMSYMERLLKTSPAYHKDNDDNEQDQVLFPPELVTMLVRNYRSHPAILKLPNALFYSDKLIASGDIMSTHSMAKWEHLPSSNENFPIIFHSIDGENLREGSSPSWFNPQEVVTVIEYVDRLVNQSRPSVSVTDIGIITPYARQVQKINLALAARNFVGIKVGSVETFQGQERRCIIISTVRSEQSLLSHDEKYNLGFVANEKRFNVALTRAKALLIVIGNPLVLATDKKNWLPFLRFCRDNHGWNGDEWNEDEDENDTCGAGRGTMPENEEEDDWEMVPDRVPQGFINREE